MAVNRQGLGIRKWFKSIPRKSLWVIPGLALLVKFIIIARLPGNAWLGADGENYLKGLEFLVRDGFFSTESILHYWPAGYPLLMWVLGAVNPASTTMIMAIAQSIFYAFASGYFAHQINRTSLKKFVIPIILILTLNPTIALNTIAIGYELISLSIFLIVLGFFISASLSARKKIFSWQLISSGLLLSLNNFVQPRFLLTSIIIFLLWGIFLYPKKLIPVVLILGFTISFIMPAIMIYRNSTAHGFAAISTNLGITMRIGAGPEATGAYVPTYPGLECPESKGNAAEIDQALTRCTIEWYLNNPVETIRLMVNKTIYFWSPWFGPLANGSMARNPWIKIHPFYGTATSSQEGSDFVYGNIGKLTSVIWMLFIYILMVIGALKMMKNKDLARQLGIIIIATILFNWLISLGTLGDHRQRLPILGLIVILQVIGFMSLVAKPKKSKVKKKRIYSKK